MAYATDEAFVAAVTADEALALAPSTEAEDGIDRALINDKLEDASATLDTYFAVKFPTPLSPVPRVVQNAAIVLARELLDRQGRDTVKAEADRIRAWARDVARGVAVLAGGQVGEDTPAPVAGDGAQFSGPDRVFTDESLAAFTGRC